MKLFRKPQSFWTELVQIDDSATPYVLGRTLVFGVVALVITVVEELTIGSIYVPLTPYEILGAALGALLVLRTNAGYERWWEARRLWGGIVNQCRNLGVLAVVHGPDDPDWRRRFVGWTAAFAHVTRRSLRSERTLPELEPLIGAVKAERIASADQMPLAVACALEVLLRDAVEMHGMERFAFLRAQEERSRLVDHLGGCERILKTPLPTAYSIEIHQFVFVFLVSLPFGIIGKAGWLTPLVTMLVAFPILALDEIGVELQNPFSTSNLNHLPLDRICQDLERNLLALLADGQTSRHALPGQDEANDRVE
jgi:putative membrane protein